MSIWGVLTKTCQFIKYFGLFLSFWNALLYNSDFLFFCILVDVFSLWYAKRVTLFSGHHHITRTFFSLWVVYFKFRLKKRQGIIHHTLLHILYWNTLDWTENGAPWFSSFTIEGYTEKKYIYRLMPDIPHRNELIFTVLFLPGFVMLMIVFWTEEKKTDFSLLLKGWQ